MSKKAAYSLQNKKLNSTVVEVILSGFGILVTGVILLAGIDEGSLALTVFGVITLAASLYSLLFYVSYSVTSERDGIRVRIFFCKDTFYPYQKIDGYRQNRHYTYLYPQGSSVIRLKNEDCDETHLKRVLARLKIRGAAKPRTGVSDSRLFWGNCSRPIQLTVYLTVLSLASLLFLGMALLLYGSYVNEDELSAHTVKILRTESDPESEDVWLIDDRQSRYYVSAEMQSYLPDSLVGEELKILIREDGEICDLRYRYNDKTVYSLDEYDQELRASNLTFAIVCTVISPIPLAYLCAALIAYRSPQKHPKLYEHFETTNYWGRH